MHSFAAPFCTSRHSREIPALRKVLTPFVGAYEQTGNHGNVPILSPARVKSICLRQLWFPFGENGQIQGLEWISRTWQRFSQYHFILGRSFSHVAGVMWAAAVQNQERIIVVMMPFRKGAHLGIKGSTNEASNIGRPAKSLIRNRSVVSHRRCLGMTRLTSMELRDNTCQSAVRSMAMRSAVP
jgi:hypothetical protein